MWSGGSKFQPYCRRKTRSPPQVSQHYIWNQRTGLFACRIRLLLTLHSRNHTVESPNASCEEAENFGYICYWKCVMHWKRHDSGCSRSSRCDRYNLYVSDPLRKSSLPYANTVIDQLTLPICSLGSWSIYSSASWWPQRQSFPHSSQNPGLLWRVIVKIDSAVMSVKTAGLNVLLRKDPQ